MTKDMTNGSPMKLILGFSIPLLFGYLFQQFYNLVDTLIVGRFLGVDALAAVGSTGSLNFLIIGFCMGVCNGFAIPLAHKFGAGDYRGLRAFMVNAIYLSAIFAVVMTAVTVVFCRPILELMRTPDNIIDGAYLYIVIIFAGFQIFSSCRSGIRFRTLPERSPLQHICIILFLVLPHRLLQRKGLYPC